MGAKFTIEKDRTKEIANNVENSRKTALTGAAMIVQGDAIVRCPVDTGNLRGSIAYEVTDKEARVGSNVEYAPYLEMGTSKMGAQPYLTPALKNNEAAIQKYISSVMKGAIK